MTDILNLGKIHRTQSKSSVLMVTDTKFVFKSDWDRCGWFLYGIMLDLRRSRPWRGEPAVSVMGGYFSQVSVVHARDVVFTCSIACRRAHSCTGRLVEDTGRRCTAGRRTRRPRAWRTGHLPARPFTRIWFSQVMNYVYFPFSIHRFGCVLLSWGRVQRRWPAAVARHGVATRWYLPYLQIYERSLANNDVIEDECMIDRQR